MSSASGKKEFFYIVVLILTFITVVIGATYALYYWFFNQEEGSSAVYTGTLSIEYLSGDIISSYYLRPTYEPTFDTINNVYRNTFRVTNTGSLDSFIDIKVRINKNDFSDETIMYSLYYDKNEENYDENEENYNENEEKIKITDYLQGEDEIILTESIFLENGVTKEFVLLVWLQENGVTQNDEMRKNLMGRIIVEASQVCETKNGDLKRCGDE